MERVLYKKSRNIIWFSLGLDFPGGSSGKKNLPAKALDVRNMGLILWGRRFPGEENSNPLQNLCLVNNMDRGAW